MIIDEFEFNEVASQYRGDNKSLKNAGPVYKLGYVGRQAGRKLSSYHLLSEFDLAVGMRSRRFVCKGHLTFQFVSRYHFMRAFFNFSKLVC